MRLTRTSRPPVEKEQSVGKVEKRKGRSPRSLSSRQPKRCSALPHLSAFRVRKGDLQQQAMSRWRSRQVSRVEPIRSQRFNAVRGQHPAFNRGTKKCGSKLHLVSVMVDMKHCRAGKDAD